MAKFFAELKRRHIYHVAVAYTVVAWMLLQVFNNLEPILTLPGWAGTLVLVLLVGGFPLSIIFAWTLDLKASPATVEAPGLRARSVGAPEQRQAGPVLAGSEPIAKTGVVSIAVLPFANMSGDANQEFFSDGMTEEITAALAQIKGLRVVGRTSAFQFKGQNKDLRSIGQTLGASHLIEGSFRKSGNRVRITAQLVHAGEDTHLWAENYDRELTDVFAVQEEIARAIAGALRVPLGLQPGEHLVTNRSIDSETYQKFLRAKALVRARGLKPLTEATALLEQVVAHDPRYAPAWALLALAYVTTPNFHPAWVSGDTAELRNIVDVLLPKAEAAAQRAIRSDARNSEGYMALANVQAQRGKFLAADELFRKALELDPNNPDALHLFSLALAGLGRLQEALAMRHQLRSLEPYVPNFNANTAIILWEMGQSEAAIGMLNDVSVDYVWRGIFLALVYSSLGRYAEAANALLTSPLRTSVPSTIETAARLLHSALEPSPASQDLPAMGFLGYFVFLHVGAQSRVLESFDGNLDAGYLPPAAIGFLWQSSYSEIRKSERFKIFANRAGLVEYWRAKGWPNFCRPTVGEDFECS